MALSRLLRNPSLRRVLGNTAWLVAGAGLRLVLGLIVAVWLARHLGPERFGRYTFAVAFALLFSPLAALGLGGIVTRDLVEQSAHRDQILGTALALRVLAATLSVCAALAAIRFIRPSDTEMYLMVAVIALASLPASLGVLESFYEARIESRFVVIARLLGGAVFFGLMILFIGLEFSLIAFVLVRLVESVVTNLGVFGIYVSQGNEPLRWRFEVSRAYAMLRQAWPLMLSGFAAIVYLKIDQVMLGKMVGDTAVGIYGVAAQISEVWYFLPVAIASSLYPSLVALRQSDQPSYVKRLQQTLDTLAWVAIAIALPVTIFASLAIDTLFGAVYHKSATILAVHIWGSVFVFMRAAITQWFIIERLFVFSLATHVVGAVINVLLNLWLIPRFEGLGAAIATVVSYSAASYLALFLYGKTRPAAMMMTRSLILPIRLARARMTQSDS